MRRITLSVLVAAATLGVAGCGDSRGTTPAGGHTYVQVPVADYPTDDLYVTLVSPVAVPISVLRAGGRIVAQAKGPQDCSYTRPFAGFRGKATYLNGKAVTLKVNGSNPITARICSFFKNVRTFRIKGSCATTRLGCADAKYSTRAVMSAFADHGIELTRGALSRAVPGVVVLRDDHQVAVWVIVNRQRLGGMFYEKKGPVVFHHRKKGNVIVFYRPVRAKAVSAVLAELGP